MTVGAAAVAAGVLLAGCTARSAPATAPIITPKADPTVTFTAVIDGDTIRTSSGVVRLIGIDAPEQGECGYAEAAQLI